MYRSLKQQMEQIKTTDRKKTNFEYRVILLKPGETPEDYPIEDRESDNVIFFGENEQKML